MRTIVEIEDVRDAPASQCRDRVADLCKACRIGSSDCGDVEAFCGQGESDGTADAA